MKLRIGQTRPRVDEETARCLEDYARELEVLFGGRFSASKAALCMLAADGADLEGMTEPELAQTLARICAEWSGSQAHGTTEQSFSPLEQE